MACKGCEVPGYGTVESGNFYKSCQCEQVCPSYSVPSSILYRNRSIDVLLLIPISYILRVLPILETSCAKLFFHAKFKEIISLLGAF